MPSASIVIREDIIRELGEAIGLRERASRLWAVASKAYSEGRTADGDAASREGDNLAQKADHIDTMVEGKEVVLKAVEAAEASGAVPKPG